MFPSTQRLPSSRPELPQIAKPRVRTAVRARLFLAVFVSWFVATLAATAGAQVPERCTSPREAADMLFHWQQPGSTDLSKAVRCFEPEGRSAKQLRDLAVQAKQVFDSRALFVDMDRLSEDPEFTDEAGHAQLVVHPELPQVTLARTADGRWLWTRDSLDYLSRQEVQRQRLVEEIAARLPASFHERLFGIKLWQYVGVGLLVIAALVLRAVVRVVFANRVKKWAETMGQKWASQLAEVTALPLSTFVMALALQVSYPVLLLPIQAGVVMSIAVRVILVLSVVWLLYRLVDLLAERMAERAAETDTKLDDQLVPLVRKSLKILVVIAGILFVLQNLHVDVGSLLTGLGIGGLAFALAAKETLANFFGSIMIFVDRPFQIGDWIVVKGAEGIVEEVGFRSTRIRTFYNSVVTMPNAVFTDAQIDNYGQREYRRTFTTLNLTYDTTPEQMQAFCEGIRAIIQANPHTRKDYYEVHMSGFGSHSLDVMVYFFFKVPSWTEELRQRHNVFLEILRLAHELKVQFAFPTQTISVDYVHPAGKPRTVQEPPAESRLADVVTAFGPSGRLARPAGPTIVEGAMIAGSVRGGNDADG